MLLDAFYICMTRLLFGCQRDSFIVLNESSLRCAYSIGFFFFGISLVAFGVLARVFMLAFTR